MAQINGVRPVGSGKGMSEAMQSALNLTAVDLRAYVLRWVAGSGQSDVKVENAIETDANTIAADNVTKENPLVQRFTGDRRTAFYRQGE